MIDVLTGERLYHRAVETAADGTVAQVAATAPAGGPHAEIVDVAGSSARTRDELSGFHGGG